MPSASRHTRSQRGSIRFMILLAVVLFAAIPIDQLMPSKKVPDGVMSTRKFKPKLNSAFIKRYLYQ